MDISELIAAIEDCEYIKEIATPTTILIDGMTTKADICEYVGLEEDPNWIALKEALNASDKQTTSS